MGIYVFKKEVLLKLLGEEMPTATDFGSEILPDALDTYNIQVFTQCSLLNVH
jgi:glucose-1-phosphate adenylyltransferase